MRLHFVLLLLAGFFLTVPPPVSSASQPGSEGGDDALVSFLLDRGQPQLALREAKRLQAVTSGVSPSPERWLELGRAAWAEGLEQAALECHATAIGALTAGETLDLARLELAFMQLMTLRVSAAQTELLRVWAFGATEKSRTTAGEMLCVTYVLEHNAEQAIQCLEESEVLNQCAPEEIPLVHEHLLKISKGSKKGPLVAAVLSGLLPGLGQLIAGEPWDALNAAALNGAWIGWAILLARSGRIFDSSLVVVALGTRFYPENIKNASRQMRARQERHRQAAVKVLLERGWCVGRDGRD